MSRKIIIDTDPGHDDAVALLLAWAAPEELEILGITTVAGNVPLDKTTNNALRLRELAGADSPIYRGCSQPLVNELETAEYVHGESGIDGPDLPSTKRSVEPLHAVEYLVETLRSTEPVTVCLLGPMTNAATALIEAPDVTAGIEQFVIMGGAFEAGGNRTRAAEFNVFVDPHAADIVLSSGVPVVVMPLDVTHKAQAVPYRIAPLRRLGTPVGEAVIAMLRFVERYDLSHNGFEGYPLHDPTVIAYLLEPELFEMRSGRVSVMLDAGASQGMTVGNWKLGDSASANAEVAFGIDADRYFELISERLATL